MFKCVFIMLALGITLQAFGQDYPGYSEKDSAVSQMPYHEKKWFAGGGLDLGFGSYTDIGVTPEIGYRITRGVAVGPVFNFNFISDNTQPGITQRYTIIGGGIFIRFYPINHIYLQVQPEFNHSSQQFKDYTGNSASRSTGVTSLLMGGGYVEQISEGSEFTFGLLYDILQNPDSPYFGYPVIGGGFDIGF